MYHVLRKLSRPQLRGAGFTVSEILFVVVVIGILATITVVTYNGSQHRASDALVRQTISDASKSLQLHYALNASTYPPNLANTNYIPPLSAPVILYTDSSQTPVYQNLNPDQNAQLFLNACNGFMPITSGSTTYNTSCSYAGNNAHVAGQVSSNVVIKGPTINQGDFVLTCGSVCTDAQNNIISTFLAQGGTFPVTVPKNGAALPAPTLMSTGPASTYCLEGRSAQFTDIIYHMTPNSSTVEEGICPTSLGLHYP